MLEPRDPSRVFRGVHFVLFGFNPLTESKFRSTLVSGGGIDLGQYNRNCTHVIVDKITYDDPVCIAARKDGKIPVTALWVEHCSDAGTLVDASSVIYRPLQDLNGIPGAEKLIVCLTGYLRQDREDIMTMVGLMGAQFSKPLMASKVTHLICYKFEGEKYELAKKLGTIKLVNHRWIEDCLKNWVLLSEDKYKKSGYELEMMGEEEEAKDSEEEAEDSELGQSGGRNTSKSPLGLKFGTPVTHGLSKSVREEAPIANPDFTDPQVLPKLNKAKDSSTTSENKNNSNQDLTVHNIDALKKSSQVPDVSLRSTSYQQLESRLKISESKNADFPKTLGCHDIGQTGNTSSSAQQTSLHGDTSETRKLSEVRSTSASAEALAHSDEKFSAMSCSRENQKGVTRSRVLDECAGIEGNNNHENFSTKVEKASELIKSTCVEGSGKGNDVIEGDDRNSLLPQKKANVAASTKSKSRKKIADAKFSIERTPLANGKSQGSRTSMVDEPPKSDEYYSVAKDAVSNSKTCLVSKSAQCDNAYQNSEQMAVQSVSESKMSGRPDKTGLGMGQGDNEEEQFNVTTNLECCPSPGKKSKSEASSDLNNMDLSNEGSNRQISKSPRKKSAAKRTLGSRPRKGVTDKLKNSASLNKTNPHREGLSSSSGSREMATSGAKKHLLDVKKLLQQETISKYAEDAGCRTNFMDDETEAPDDRFDFEFRMDPDEELVHLSKKANTATEEKSEAVQHVEKCEEAVPPKEDTNENEKQKGSTSKLRVKHQAKKRPASRTEKTTVAKESTKLETPGDRFDFECGMAPDEELVHLSKKANTATEEKSEAVQHVEKCEEAMPPKEDTNENEKQKGSTSKLRVKHQAQKRPASRTKKTTVAKESTKIETPGDRFDFEFGMAPDEELVHLSKKANTATEEKSEAVQHVEKCEEAVPPKEDTNENKKQKGSTSKLKVKHQAKKRPASRTEKTTVAKELTKPEEAVSEDAISNQTRDKAEIKILKEMSLPADTSENSTVTRNKTENFIEEKENTPIDGEHGLVEGRDVENQTVKSSVKPANINSKMELNPSISESNARVKTEARCFILSGHRLQRKEFQQVIKRLKGRVCRDSHQWSYQATHFIAPDPIRRTEKFFAATASGRWILKTDFLTASSQAGKLLPEEPYEWHKSGLSEDGAINMEAPRKWRLLKEKTGHGAFYGMRIVVYGDFISPPLDTLKRVVKAGDGTILATSPPYTRFLDTGIDFAIVSPGMPRVDVWVQEFLKHEIPCVVADYLVEYVCKPGFSLERHVLYGTHPWAERSYAKLQSKAEEIIEGLIPPEDCNDDDVPCQVCGSRNRGDVMLICGDERGSVGCGVGTHIDCCDPPLTEVPEEDWFCPKCSSTRNCSNNPSKKRKKGALSSTKTKS